MKKIKENNTETKLEYEMRHPLLFPEDIAPKLKKCFDRLYLSDTAKEYRLTGDERYEEYKGYEISDEYYIDTIGKILQYNIRTTWFNLEFQDIYINRMCNLLRKDNLSDEQKEKIKDISETYYKYFIVEIADFNELYERRKIIDRLDDITGIKK